MRSASLVSLFTGAGGLDIGLELAGFETVAANDFDADCVKTLLTNQAARIPVPGGGNRRFLERARVLGSPVEDLTAADLRPAGVAGRWSPDLLAGGPPCQPFSSSGKMLSLSDPRGRLFEHFVRLAADLQPRVILFENVRGLVTARGPQGTPGEALDLVKRAFEAIGYATSFALLNSADYGAPQRRVRLFMLARKTGQLPSFPEPTHAETSDHGLFEDRLLPWVTLGGFLAGRDEPHPSDLVRPSARLALQLRDVPSGSGLRSPGSREATRPGGHWGYKQGTFIADPKRPARTVTAAATQDWVRGADGSLRRLTWKECAALQGFPDAWEFTGNTASRHRQIGNAVPVVFGRVLGASILEASSSRDRKPTESAPLPPSFVGAIRYTAREHARNGESRRQTGILIAAGADPRLVKGTGSEDRRKRQA